MQKDVPSFPRQSSIVSFKNSGVSKFPTDINLQDSEMRNQNSQEFLGIPQILSDS